ncbi:MAG: thioredoxin domain-containing protein [Deltaproteobacteria bacterium]|nr:thioredoxin domain-containing protein [Deltaproteobacteria bacterium]MBI3295189.1 thioredoxin domain-containing protein [Deltaproteobacteria bacterium]
MPKLTRKRLYSLQLLSTLSGLAVSVYLLVQHTRVKNGIQGTSSFCSFGKYADCDIVNTSAYSEIFGFPVASVGALFYTVLLALSIVSPPNHTSFNRFQRYFAILASVGLAIDLVLLGVQLGVLHNFCLLCFTSYLATVAALFTASRLPDGLSGNTFVRLKSLMLQRKKGPVPPQTNCVAAAIVIVALAATIFLLPAQILLNSATHQKVENIIEKFMDDWKDMKRKNIDVKPGDATMGNSASKVRIIAFSDFECPHCQHAAFALNTALKPYQDRVYLVFKHFPLDSSCNRLVNFRMHENACQLARVAYCANKKGKFWEYHDRVFRRASRNDHPKWDQFTATMDGLLTDKEITACLNNSAALQNVKSDIELGDSLGVRGTPSVFINGKQITVPITVETIQRLVQMEFSL